ncbi:4-coumarate-CoA ligase-like protein [Neofusicoccum parvum]|nr:4-coumarate-CoA ligase-like protein [Neofusicoccum parvum]
MPFLATQHVDIPAKDILSWCYEEAEVDIDKPIYIDAADPSQSYSARQSKDVIRKLCAGFKAAGLKKGDVVCMHAFNSIDYPIIVNGIIAFGGIFSGTNPAYTSHEIAHAIRVGSISAFIAEPGLLANVLTAAAETNLPVARIWAFDRTSDEKLPEGIASWRNLLKNGESDWERFEGLEQAKATEAVRLFSSGTTGLPKAARISHHNIIAQHHLTIEKRPFEVRRLIIMPLFHAGMVPNVHFASLKIRSPLYMMKRFDLETYMLNMERYQINELVGAPPMIRAILETPAARKYSLASVKYGLTAAAPLDKGTLARMKTLLLPGTPVTQTWGMTEMTCQAMGIRYPEDDDEGSVGYPMPNLDLKIIDEKGDDITGYDVRGELCVRGPIVFMGYWNQPDANNKDFDYEGYFRTGDIVHCSGRTKKWFIVDRKKELIKVRGFQVAPPELEGVLTSHPQIIDAAVIGVTPTKSGSELPRAYVVRRPGKEGEKLTEKEVRAYVEERLASYKRLEGGVVFLQEIPKSPSGKILKRILRERATKELGAKL